MDPVHSTVSALGMGRDPPVPQGFASQASSALAGEGVSCQEPKSEGTERGRSRARTRLHGKRWESIVLGNWNEQIFFFDSLV